VVVVLGAEMLALEILTAAVVRVWLAVLARLEQVHKVLMVVQEQIVDQITALVAVAVWVQPVVMDQVLLVVLAVTDFQLILLGD
jgi:hypothetical protein